MTKALLEAEKGLGFTSPNPAVGAVIVKNNKIIGLGYHQKTGLAHAEIIAIQSVKNKQKIKGAELYVTLEPCCHQGKTPPCVEMIKKVGIKKIYVGLKDPSKKVNGKGIKFLLKHNIGVELLDSKSDLVKKISELNGSFIKYEKIKLPYVIIKVAASLDGKIATKTGDSKWITNYEARKNARLERSLCDAILVGSGTVKVDNPELAPHGKYKNKKLLRIIIDNNLTTSIKSKVYRDKNVLVCTTNLASKQNQNKFTKNSIKLQVFKTKSKIKVIELLKYLSSIGVQKLFVEGGSEVHGLFMDAQKRNSNIIDKIIIYLAPKIIGGHQAKVAIGGEGVNNVLSSLKVINFDYKKIGDNLKITGQFEK